MRWSTNKNRWESDVYRCTECDKAFTAHGTYMKHNYDHRRSKKTFPKGMQKASQILLLGFMANKVLA